MVLRYHTRFKICMPVFGKFGNATDVDHIVNYHTGCFSKNKSYIAEKLLKIVMQNDCNVHLTNLYFIHFYHISVNLGVQIREDNYTLKIYTLLYHLCHFS